MTILKNLHPQKAEQLPPLFRQLWTRSLLTAQKGMTYWDVPEGKPYVWRHQEHYLFILNLQGQGRMRFPREQELLRQGNMVLVPPHCPLRLERDRGWGLKIFVIQCALISPPPLNQNPWQRLALPCQVPHPDPESLREELELLRERAEDPPRGRYRDPYGIPAMALLQEQLSLYLMEGFSLGLLKEELPVPPGLKRARLYLHHHYQNPDLQVEDLAREAGLSVNKLIEGFRLHFNETPAQLLHQQRIHLATHLLTGNPDVTLEHIAHRCGYRDRSSLHRQFVKRMGLSPGAFRKQHPGHSQQRPALQQKT